MTVTLLYFQPYLDVGEKMGFITLIKTADENPTGFTVISSVMVKKYAGINSLFDILSKEVYSFAIHGENSGILPLATDFSSDEDVFKHLSKHWIAFKKPETSHITEFKAEILATFVYECGYKDGLNEKIQESPEG